ncbi:AI-2E family transporter, partial [Candidatus Collierbacteria bacterium]|nr:AI-2E family transporter [Candidatus Collierbacteria bacterium]
VMQKAIGLHPVVTIIVLSIGFKLGGPILAILALPVVLSLRVLFAHLHHPTEKEIASL